MAENFLGATDSPYTVILGDGKTYTFPKLTLRNIGVLASKCKAIKVKQLRDLIKEEELQPEAKARFLALTVSRDFNIADVWEWSVSIDGGIEIATKSLTQGGMSAEEATKVIDQLGAENLIVVAMEACDHENSPSRQAKRLIEAKKESEKVETSEDPK